MDKFQCQVERNRSSTKRKFHQQVDTMISDIVSIINERQDMKTKTRSSLANPKQHELSFEDSAMLSFLKKSKSQLYEDIDCIIGEFYDTVLLKRENELPVTVKPTIPLRVRVPSRTYSKPPPDRQFVPIYASITVKDESNDNEVEEVIENNNLELALNDDISVENMVPQIKIEEDDTTEDEQTGSNPNETTLESTNSINTNVKIEVSDDEVVHQNNHLQEQDSDSSVQNYNPRFEPNQINQINYFQETQNNQIINDNDDDPTVKSSAELQIEDPLNGVGDYFGDGANGDDVDDMPQYGIVGGTNNFERVDHTNTKRATPEIIDWDEGLQKRMKQEDEF